jgi:hypothetical protein
MRINKYTVLVVIVLLPLGSCTKIEHLSPIPSIRFTSFTVFDTATYLGDYKAGKLKFYFEDGDGDLGLQAPSENQTDTTNLFLTLFRKEGGIMVPVYGLDPMLPFSEYRIPYMVRLGQNKILRGTISVTFLYLSYSPNDTIQYEFKIEDRALHESNIGTTSEIIISTNNIYQ